MLRRERIPGVSIASQEEVLSTGKARGTPGFSHHFKSRPDVLVHSRGTCFPCTASTFMPRSDSHNGGPSDSPVRTLTPGKATCGMTLEFLSTLLLRVPPLEMWPESLEFFRDQAGKGSLISNYEAERGLLWMWAGLSCFLSSGDGYVGEILELKQGCEGPFESSRR